MHFDRNLSCDHAKEPKRKRKNILYLKKMMVSNFGVFIGRFPSEGAANMAVKELTIYTFEMWSGKQSHVNHVHV